MGWNSNTNTITSPLSIGDISNALDVESGDLGTLCQSSSINKWSKHKPVRHYKLGELTAAELTYTNYGFRTDNSGTGSSTQYGIKATNLTSLFTQAAANLGDWPYDKPRGSAFDEWFRMMDFVGYKNNANIPYEVSCSDSYTTKGNTCQVFDNAFEGADLSLLDFTGFATMTDTGRTVDEWRLGVAWRVGSGTISANYLSKTLEDCFEDLDGKGGRELIPMGNLVGNEYVLSTGTYNWCAFITDYDPSDSPNSGYSYKYVYLPGGYGSMSVADSGGSIQPSDELFMLEMTDVYDQSGSHWENTYVSDLGFGFFVRPKSNDYSIDLFVEIFDAQGNKLASAAPEGINLLVSDGDIDDIVIYVDDLNFRGNYTTEDVYVSVYYKYRLYSSPSWTPWTVGYLNPVSGQEYSGQIVPSKLQDIIDALDEDNV